MRKDTCTRPELRSWIHSLVLGWLSVRKAKRLERHISACPACQIEKEFFLICLNNYNHIPQVVETKSERVLAKDTERNGVRLSLNQHSPS
jgi:hypothetical protein